MIMIVNNDKNCKCNFDPSTRKQEKGKRKRVRYSNILPMRTLKRKRFYSIFNFERLNV